MRIRAPFEIIVEGDAAVITPLLPTVRTINSGLHLFYGVFFEE